jgi:hypothetical protein
MLIAIKRFFKALLSIFRSKAPGLPLSVETGVQREFAAGKGAKEDGIDFVPYEIPFASPEPQQLDLRLIREMARMPRAELFVMQWHRDEKVRLVADVLLYGGMLPAERALEFVNVTNEVAPFLTQIQNKRVYFENGDDAERDREFMELANRPEVIAALADVKKIQA